MKIMKRMKSLCKMDRMKRIKGLAVTAVVAVSVLLPAVGAYGAAGTLLSTETVTRGAKLEHWTYPTSAGTAKVAVLEIDLKDPYIKVDAIFGKDGKTGNKQSVTNMLKEAGAVAGINGDFFTLNAEGAPFGGT